MCRDGSHALNQRWMRVVVSGPDATHTVSGSGGTLVSACLVGKLVSKPQPMRNADQRGAGAGVIAGVAEGGLEASQGVKEAKMFFGVLDRQSDSHQFEVIAGSHKANPIC